MDRSSGRRRRMDDNADISNRLGGAGSNSRDLGCRQHGFGCLGASDASYSGVGKTGGFIGNLEPSRYSIISLDAAKQHIGNMDARCV